MATSEELHDAWITALHAEAQLSCALSRSSNAEEHRKIADAHWGALLEVKRAYQAAFRNEAEQVAFDDAPTEPQPRSTKVLSGSKITIPVTFMLEQENALATEPIWTALKEQLLDLASRSTELRDAGLVEIHIPDVDKVKVSLWERGFTNS